VTLVKALNLGDEGLAQLVGIFVNRWDGAGGDLRGALHSLPRLLLTSGLWGDRGGCYQRHGTGATQNKVKG
jgi:hypothetical protein